MTPTLLESQERLFLLLDAPLEDVDAVYDHEPGAEATGPRYVTIALERVTATEQVWTIRIYSQTTDGLADATTGLYSALPAVDERLRPLGPSEWEFGYVDAVSSLVARSSVAIPRETF